MLYAVRALALLLVAAVALQSGCSSEFEPSSPGTGEAWRLDREVVFLPPLVAPPADQGDIVLDAMPTVVAEQVDPADGTTVTRTLRTWTRAATRGTTPRIRVHRQPTLPDDGDSDPSGYFSVPFRPKDFGLAGGDLVQLRVELDGDTLGTANLEVLGRGVKRVEPGQVAVGTTLEARFRVDRVSADGDSDFDDVADDIDNCPETPNNDQQDTVGDGVGDACRCDTVTCAEAGNGCAAETCGPTTGECSDPYCIDDHPATLSGVVYGTTFGLQSGATVAVTGDGQTIFTGTAFDGTFSIEIPFAECDLVVSKARFHNHTAHLSFSPDSMAENYEVILAPSVATYDVVVWSALFIPLPDASVTLTFDGGYSAGGVTDDAGHLQITDLPIGVGFQLLVTGEGPTYNNRQDPLFAGYNSVTVGLYD